ncbi:MAG: MBL fold metallo-hydrolase [Candidatus Marinimicrobia bacterium]|nr:MBL fold metallo-hydrolase [Candidatus Neomarinimicrobiota bacterium]|tara:strand:- start:19082 stop:19942 length:861 start_codon:yes stop_codon:yes gene_type:complete
MQLENIGKWKVFAIESGFFKLDGGAMMGSVPKVLWEKTNPPDKLNRINLSLRCLLVDDGENVVLIESGIGQKNSKKFKKIFAIDHSEYTLSNTLSKYGYSFKDITHVILTHLHFDHSGGAIYYDENRCSKIAFPNAKYYVSKKNWDIALNPSPRDSASYLKDNYKLLDESNVLELFNDNDDILNGISGYAVDGHTIGQQLIKVSDKGSTLVFVSDLIPLKSHLKLPWIMGYDLNAALTLKEKKIFLDEASDKNWLLFFYHDPDTIAVKICKDKKYYKIINEYRREK